MIEDLFVDKKIQINYFIHLYGNLMAEVVSTKAVPYIPHSLLSFPCALRGTP